MEKMRMESIDITTQNIEKIGSLFPNCITETVDENGTLKKAINFDLFRQMLSSDVVDGNEAYEFTWVGKKASIIEANKPIRKTLRPCKEESLNWDTTENLYIEGDNLEVLKLLQESYLGKVKMIYIDPPYNTGNDFIYNDDFKMSRDEYSYELGECDDDGNRMFKNTDSNGRFHSDWCSMIYPRLMLARNLLSDDGVIFISIDDNEQAQLKLLCDNIFGEENFYKIIAVEMSKTQGMKVKAAQKGEIVKNKEFIFIYTKSINNFKLKQKRPLYENIPYYDIHFSYYALEKDKEVKKLVDILKDNDATRFEINRLERINSFSMKNIDFFIQNSDIISKFILENLENIYSDGNANINIPKSVLNMVNDNTFTEFLSEDNKVYKLLKTGNGTIRQLIPLSSTYNLSDDFYPKYGRSVIKGDFWKEFSLDMGNINKEGNIEFKNGKKPIRLIKQLLKWQNANDSIVLDFFSGSGTTAHAVMQINAEDGGNRKFIMVQLPERTDEKSEAYKAGYANICEIGKERIRRAGNKIVEENKNKEGIEKLDTGFRVLKLDDSNMNDVYYNPSEYSQDLLSMLESNVKSDRNDLDLLFGCLLEWGLPLSLSYNSYNIDGCTVHNYNDGDLIACFDENIPDSVIKEIAKKQPLRAVFRDSSFKDSPSKINVGEIFKLMSPDTRIKVI